MRLATWNINGLKARLDYLLLWLADRQPDVVGLQELKSEDSKVPHIAFEAAGYDVFSYGQKSWNGCAVLVRKDLLKEGSEVSVVQRGLPGEEEFGSRLITVRLTETPLGPFEFTTVYCPNGKTADHDDFPKKLAWFDSLTGHLKSTSESTEGARVVCGDFNLCPAGIDSWNEGQFAGQIFHTDEERSRFADLLGTGLVDVYRELYPDEQKFSWWDYRAGAFHRKMGLRIDFVLTSPELAEQAEEAWIDRDYRKKKEGMIASDHAPVLVDLNGTGEALSGTGEAR